MIQIKQQAGPIVGERGLVSGCQTTDVLKRMGIFFLLIFFRKFNAVIAVIHTISCAYATFLGWVLGLTLVSSEGFSPGTDETKFRCFNLTENGPRECVG